MEKQFKPATQPLAQIRLAITAARAGHHEAPTASSWAAFVAERRALHAAQLRALKRK